MQFELKMQSDKSGRYKIRIALADENAKKRRTGTRQQSNDDEMTPPCLQRHIVVPGTHLCHSYDHPAIPTGQLL